MAATQRKLLEQLMGRDALVGSRGHSDVPITDPRVCASFVVGSCPHDVFLGTKQDMGRCPKLHREKHRLEYQLGPGIPALERAYVDELRHYVGECDRRIEAASARITASDTARRDAEEAGALADTEALIALAQQEVAALIARGFVAKAVQQLAVVDELCRRRAALAAQRQPSTGDAAQKLQACEVCGAYLSHLDNDRRLADHFIGKIHMGYATLRGEMSKWDKQIATSS